MLYSMKESNTNLIYKKKEEHSVIIPDSALMRRRVTLGKSDNTEMMPLIPRMSGTHYEYKSVTFK